MKSNFHTLAIIIILLGLCSCYSNNSIVVKAYEGPKQEKASLASVKGSYNSNISKKHTFTQISQIDSIPVTIGKHKFFPKSCDILPGTHTIETWCWNNDAYPMRGRFLVTFDAKAGRTYTINAKITHDKNSVEVYVTDDKEKLVESSTKYKFLLNGKE